MNRTAILILCLIIVLGGGVYYFFFFQNDTGGVVEAVAPAGEAEAVFIDLVGKIDPIVFTTTLLQDPRFIALRDIRTTVIPESAGRVDPFAPLGR